MRWGSFNELFAVRKPENFGKKYATIRLTQYELGISKKLVLSLVQRLMK